MDYAPIQAFLVGRCGMTLRNAALTPIEEFNILAEGFAKKEQEE